MLVRAQNLLRLPTFLSHNESRDIDLERGPVTTSYFKDEIYTDLYQSLVQPDSQQDKVVDECWKWFCCYLDASIRRNWEKLLQGVIRGLGPTYPREAAEWLRQVYNVYAVLNVIANAVSSRGDISIDGIITGIPSARVLQSGEEDGQGGRPANNNEIRQAVWCLIGMLTMLYDPKPQLHGLHLSLRQPTSRLRSARRNRPGAGGIFVGQQDISKSEDPLHSLLAQFGDVLPKVEVDQGYLSTLDTDYINIAYINFYTLKNVAKLEIEWVNTLNLHLQLDKRRRVLRLFRFPAFCRLLWTEDEDSFMSRLFADHRRSQVDGNLHTEHSFSDYLREVILSYRLLFGIDSKSRKAFQKELPAWRAGLRYGSSSTGTHTTSDPPVANPPVGSRIQHPYNSVMDDPLLLLLCTTTTSTESRSRIRRFWNWTRNRRRSRTGQHQDPFPANSLHELLQSLRGEEKSGLYDLEDFPFLGRRLAEIQRFSQKQKPNDWKSLFWVDRRDPQSFWNFWIAWVLLVIGGGTIVLQFWQLVFQIWGDFRVP